MSEMRFNQIEIGDETIDQDDIKRLRDLLANAHINLLVGAGFSADVLKTLGKREEWLTWASRQDWSCKEWKVAAEGLLQLEYFKNVVSPMADVQPTESMLSFVENIRRIIGTRGTTTMPRRANVFTTNYDPLLEKSFEEVGCIYNDGFEGRARPVYATRSFGRLQYSQSLSMEYATQIPTVNLIKLHGSLTWRNDVITGRIGYQDMGDAVDKLKDGSEALSNAWQYKCVESIVEHDVEPHASSMRRAIESVSQDYAADLEAFLHEYRQAFCIINPTKRKFEETVFGLTYYELLRLYANELDRNNALLISFGFSFADEHIHEITMRALENPQLILLICCYEKKDLEWYQQKFPRMQNVWYLVPKGCRLDLAKLCSVLDEVR